MTKPKSTNWLIFYQTLDGIFANVFLQIEEEGLTIMDIKDLQKKLAKDHGIKLAANIVICNIMRLA